MTYESDAPEEATPAETDREAIIAALRDNIEVDGHGLGYIVKGLGKAADAILARRAPMEAKPVGEAGSMPGSSGFTMVAFKASEVPIGTKLYAKPPPRPRPWRKGGSAEKLRSSKRMRFGICSTR